MARTASRRILNFVGALQSAQLRTEQLDGVEHVVVPVVALVEGVLHASNAPAPELVRFESFAVSPQQWNGRPVVCDHPADAEGEPVSANDLHVREAVSFGWLANAAAANGRLLVEAWLNPEKARRVGRDAARVVERVRAGEVVEVSVGAWVTTEARRGVWRRPDGTTQEYQAEWVTVASDHLAMLPEGATGACSVAAGCGAPRAAHAYRVEKVGQLWSMSACPALAADEGARMAKDTEAKDEKGLLGKLAALLFRGAAEMSDEERRELLFESLRRLESQLVRIMSVTGSDGGTVVYLIDPDPGGPTPYKPYQRTYAIAADGRVTFEDDRVPVRARTEWVPLMAKAPDGTQEQEQATAGASPTTAADCGCGGRGKADITGADAGAKGDAMDKAHRNAERIKALIGNEKTLWSADDQAYLEGLTDERLAAFEAAVPEEPAAADTAPAAAETKADAEPEKADGSTVQVSAEELAELRRHAAERKAERATKKAALVASLKGAQKTYSEDRLKGMELEQLQEVASLVGATAAADYSGQAGGSSAGLPESAKPLNSYDRALAARKGQASK